MMPVNGNVKGDEEGEYIFTSANGCTIIDYIMKEEEGRLKVKKMVIGDRVDSDHQSVEVWLEGVGTEITGEESGEDNGGECRMRKAARNLGRDWER